MSVSSLGDREGLTAEQAMARAHELEEQGARAMLDRRRVLQITGSAAAAGAATWMLAKPARAATTSTGPTKRRVAIIGGGLAGLVCADYLQTKGIVPTIYESTTRAGGRQWSLSGFFPGQVAEIGGELIDGPHKTMLGYANAFNLAKEDRTKLPGEAGYFINGKHYNESEIVDEFATFSKRAAADVKSLSAATTALKYTATDQAFDNLSITDFLNKHASDLNVLRPILLCAYEGEYGLPCDQQSALNLIYYLKWNRSSKLRMFGSSNERYHLTNGNEGIAKGIAAKLTNPIQYGYKLKALTMNASGEYVCTFDGIGSTVTADAVVLAMPFTTLRNVTLDASLKIPANQVNAINTLGYGMNAKTMVGFDARVWLSDYDVGGETYVVGLENQQIDWETNPTLAGANAIITDYASASRSLSIGSMDLQKQVGLWMDDFDKVFPGAKATASKVSGAYRAYRAHWPTLPGALGSYTCYKKGQFTTVCGLEGLPVGRLKFAGEHANSFYMWQGFMEGACLSGIDAASSVLADIKAGVL